MLHINNEIEIAGEHFVFVQLETRGCKMKKSILNLHQLSALKIPPDKHNSRLPKLTKVNIGYLFGFTLFKGPTTITEYIKQQHDDETPMHHGIMANQINK
jgi:hypothetical protein